MKIKVTDLKLDDIIELIYNDNNKVKCYRCEHNIFKVKDKDYIQKYFGSMLDTIYNNIDPIALICTSCKAVSYMSIRYTFQGYANKKINIVI